MLPFRKVLRKCVIRFGVKRIGDGPQGVEWAPLDQVPNSNFRLRVAVRVNFSLSVRKGIRHNSHNRTARVKHIRLLPVWTFAAVPVVLQVSMSIRNKDPKQGGSC